MKTTPKTKLYKIVATVLVTIFTLFALTACEFLDQLLRDILDSEYTPRQSGDSIQSDYFAHHLIGEDQREENPIRPIDDPSVETVDLTHLPYYQNSASSVNGALATLLETVTAGKRPILSQDPENPVTQIYNAAIEVLDTYIKNDFTQFERILAIYEWIIYFVDYDYALLDAYLIDGPIEGGNDNPAFHMSGVFISRLAVCDGMSKAFSLLAGIEGIEAQRILGWYPNYDNGKLSQYVGHAWNKVNVATPDPATGEYGEKHWYLVDVTFGNFAIYNSSQNRYTEYLTRAYFLIEDSPDHLQDDLYHQPKGATINKKDTPSKASYPGGGNKIYAVADTVWDYYAWRTYEYEGATYRPYAHTLQEVKNYLQSYAVPNKFRGVEIKLVTPAGTAARDAFDFKELEKILRQLSGVPNGTPMGYYTAGLHKDVLMITFHYPYPTQS